MGQDSYLRLYPCCVIVKGVASALIQDLDRRKMYRISIDLYKVLTSGSAVKCTKLPEECINFLLENQLAFIEVDAIKGLVSPIKKSYDLPFAITNAIVDTDESLKSLIFFLKDGSLGCIPTIQIRFFGEPDVPSVMDILKLTNESDRFNSLQILVPKYFQHSLSLLNDLSRLDMVYIFDTDENISIKGLKYSLVTVKASLQSPLQCGCISPDQFSNNFETYFESQHHNTCLNRKISVDVDGNIKNCPSMANSYGNIKDTRLIDVVHNPEFQKIWNVKKDEISKCKDCEFRHVCTDCRAYLDNPDDIYSAPLKCGYNPYTCEWEEWSTNPLKQQAIEYYGMQEWIKHT